MMMQTAFDGSALSPAVRRPGILLLWGMILVLVSCGSLPSEPEVPADEPETAAWTRLGGPLGGMGYDIRMHPGNSDIMYVTDSGGGVFRTSDAGRTWDPINHGITTRSGTTGELIPIFCLSIDPGNPDILWVGTEGQSAIYRSGDGGASWVPMHNGIIEKDLTFRGFAVNPGNSDVVFAAAEVPSREWAPDAPPSPGMDRTKGVVYRTTDGGRNWRRIWYGNNLARYILIDPRNTDVVYVSTGIFDRNAADTDVSRNIPGGVGVIKSTDGGETWFPVNRGLENLFVGSLVMHPDNPDILMAGVGNLTFYQEGGVYLTTDGGQSWEFTLDGYEIESVEFAPSNPDIAYAANAENFYRSEDGGYTWEMMLRGHGLWWGDEGLSIGQPIDIEVDPADPDRIFVNSYGGGVFVSTDGGRIWQNASRGYSGAQVRDLALVSGAGSGIIAVARSGIFVSENYGEDWQSLAAGEYRALDWNIAAVKPDEPKIFLSGLSCRQELVRSENGGSTWMNVDKTADNYAWGAVVFAPSDPDTVYAGTVSYHNCGSLAPGHYTGMPAGGIRKSIDGGITWRDANTGATEQLSIHGLTVHPGNPDIVLCGSDGNGLWRTADGGETWETIGGTAFGGKCVSFVGFHQLNPGTVFAGLRHGGLHISRDGGETWEIAGYGMAPEATISDMVFDPEDGNTVYASDVLGGVYRSADGGIEWYPINDGLTVRAVNSLAITEDGGYLYATTEGAGVFRLDLE